MQVDGGVDIYNRDEKKKKNRLSFRNAPSSWNGDSRRQGEQWQPGKEKKDWRAELGLGTSLRKKGLDMRRWKKRTKGACVTVGEVLLSFCLSKSMKHAGSFSVGTC